MGMEHGTETVLGHSVRLVVLFLFYTDTLRMSHYTLPRAPILRVAPCHSEVTITRDPFFYRKKKRKLVWDTTNER